VQDEVGGAAGEREREREEAVGGARESPWRRASAVVQLERRSAPFGGHAAEALKIGYSRGAREHPLEGRGMHGKW